MLTTVYNIYAKLQKNVITKIFFRIFAFLSVVLQNC